jgi:hypothetical protein
MNILKYTKYFFLHQYITFCIGVIFFSFSFYCFIFLLPFPVLI